MLILIAAFSLLPEIAWAVNVLRHRNISICFFICFSKTDVDLRQENKQTRSIYLWKGDCFPIVNARCVPIGFFWKKKINQYKATSSHKGVFAFRGRMFRHFFFNLVYGIRDEIKSLKDGKNLRVVLAYQLFTSGTWRHTWQNRILGLKEFSRWKCCWRRLFTRTRKYLSYLESRVWTQSE